jgi:glycyl-tRNA synthetase (class II)
VAEDAIRSENQQLEANQRQGRRGETELQGVEDRAAQNLDAARQTAIQNSDVAQALVRDQLAVNERVHQAVQEYGATLAGDANATAEAIAHGAETNNLENAELVNVLQNSPEVLTADQDAVVQQIITNLRNESSSTQLYVIRKILGPTLYYQIITH